MKMAYARKKTMTATVDEFGNRPRSNSAIADHRKLWIVSGRRPILLTKNAATMHPTMNVTVMTVEPICSMLFPKPRLSRMAGANAWTAKRGTIKAVQYAVTNSNRPP